MREFIREYGEIIIAVIIFSIMMAAALSVGPSLKEALINTVDTVISASEGN